MKPMNKTISVMIASLCGAMALPTHSQTTNIQYSYSYDNNSNVKQIADALGHLTVQGYDALNRRSTTTDANSMVTTYGYTPLDQLTAVQDPRNLTTTYSLDAFGDVNQLQSPDSGTTVNTYDLNGNLKTRLDAKGQLTTYTYDAMNRVTQILYSDGSTAVFGYDNASNGTGLLLNITDVSGGIAYVYDGGSRLTTETRTINVKTVPNGSTTPTNYVTGYGYDSIGRLASITYPSGRVISYTRDSLGRIATITSLHNGTTTVLVSQVNYRPFGGVASYINGTGNTTTYQFDLSGRMTGYTLNNELHTLTYDGASNVSNYTDAGSPSKNATYGYDPLNRLTSATNGVNSFTYNYDANGNRSNNSVNSASATNTIASNSNQMSQIGGSSPISLLYDGNGSITNYGNSVFTYDTRGRLISTTTAGGVVQYTLNALGQRVEKVSSGGYTVFEYDSSGKLIGETNGTHGKDYVYLGDIPVAVVSM